jgi:hypothetical protein
MQRWIWTLVIFVACGAGLVAGVTWPRQTSTEQASADLQRQIGTLQDELRARDATIAALQQQLQATTTRLTPPTLPTPSVQTKPTQDQAQPVPKGVAKPPPKAATEAPSKTAPAPEPTKEAALDLFQRFQQQTAGLERPARLRQGRALLDALLEIGEPAVDALLQVLQDSAEGRERRDAAVLLGGLQNPRAIPALVEMIDNEEDLLTRRAAARGLARLQLPEALPALEAVLVHRDEDRFVRMSAAYGLAQLGKPQGFSELAHIYNEASTDGNGRFTAFQALASLQNTQALPFMHEVVTRESEVGYRFRALQFIAKTGDQQSLPLLQKIIENPDEQPSIREAAEQAYTTITKPAPAQRRQ